MGLFDFFKKKNDNTPLQEIEPNLPQLQFVSLFYESKPTLDKELILAELNTRFTVVDTSEEESPLVFFFPDFMVNLNEASIPAQGAIIEVDTKINLDRFSTAFQQSWHWSEAESIMQKCNFEINLTDLMSKTLPPQIRILFFQKFIISIIKATKPTAIYFKNSDKLLNPSDFLENCDIDNGSYLHGAMNIRLFNITNNGKDEIIMDTIGLHAYGMADLECRFSEYNPNDISGILHNVAYYIFDSGDSIRDNSTIQGVGKNPIWKTKYADSKVSPQRLVVEVIPN